MKSCNKIGAPADLNLDECFQTNEGCDAYKEGACTIDGSSHIITLNGINQAECQVILFFYFSLCLLVVARVLVL